MAISTVVDDAPASFLGHALFSIGQDEWTPLYLSCIAGASTCLGAAVVFLHPRDVATNQRSVENGTMSFSLALAGSVMVTVSVISIGPECLQDPNHSIPFQYMPVWSWVFVQRLVSFGVGCWLYWGLSYFAFPEPEELVTEAVQQQQPQNTSQAKRIPSSVDFGNTSSRHSGGSGNIDTAYMRRKGSTNNVVSLAGSEHASSVEDEELIGASALPTAHHQPKCATTPDRLQSSTHNSIDDDAYQKNDKTSAVALSRWSSGADLSTPDQRRAWRIAMLLFVSLLCHNFPEGLAVAASALESDALGIAVTIGIMIHNIPEGIAIAIPCLAARPDQPWLAFLLASASGLAEPLGAFVALLFLRGVDKATSSTQWLSMENVLAFVAGIMIAVALYELFPEANRHATESKRPMLLGMLSGVVVMVATELSLA